MSDDQQWRGQVDTRLTVLERDMIATRQDSAELRKLLGDNTALTYAVKADTAQLVEIFKASKVNFRILKWLASVSATVMTAWAAWRGFH